MVPDAVEGWIDPWQRESLKGGPMRSRGESRHATGKAYAEAHQCALCLPQGRRFRRPKNSQQRDADERAVRLRVDRYHADVGDYYQCRVACRTTRVRAN